jgi:hypothetical protein
MFFKLIAYAQQIEKYPQSPLIKPRTIKYFAGLSIRPGSCPAASTT